MNYRRYFVLSLVLVPVQCYGASGTEGASFLDIPVGARPAALGSAYAALASDVYATVWNPAGLGFVKSTEAAGQHLDYLEGIHNEYVGAAFPLSPGKALGFSVQYLGSGDIPSTDNSGSSIGTFSSHYGAYSLAYGQRLSDQCSLGAAGKWINARIGDFSANAYAGSLGAMYRPMDEVRVGGVVDNFGSKLTFLNAGDSLPLTGRLGLAYKPDYFWTLTVEGDYDQTGLASAHTGLEWRPLEGFALRAGYHTDTLKELSALAGLSAGMGLSLWDQELSYAWVPVGDLGNTHYFSFIVRFGPQDGERRNLIYFRPSHRDYYVKAKVPDDNLQSEEEIQDILHLITVQAQ